MRFDAVAVWRSCFVARDGFASKSLLPEQKAVTVSQLPLPLFWGTGGAKNIVANVMYLLSFEISAESLPSNSSIVQTYHASM